MGKVRGRPFAPGNDYGKGRPKGSRNKASLMDELLGDYAEALIKKCIFSAVQGDRSALRLCIERILPPLRDSYVNFQLPETNTVQGVNAAFDSILQAVAQGDIAPAQAEALASVLDARRSAIETRELAERLTKLEKASQAEGFPNEQEFPASH